MGILSDIAGRLSSPSEAIRIFAAEDLGAEQRADSAHLLVERLAQEQSRAVQQAIFHALTAIGVEAVAGYVPSLLESEDPYVRNQAVRMVQGGGTTSVPIVRELLASSDHDIRKLAVDVLSGLRFEDAADLYAIAIGDPDMNVVITAMESIRPRQNARLADLVVQKVLEANHPMLLLAGLESLVRLQDRSAYIRFRARFCPLTAIDSLVLPHAVKLAGQHGGEQEMQELAELLPRANAVLRSSAFDAIHALFSRGLPIPAGVDRHLLAALAHDSTGVTRYQLLVIAGDFRQSEAVIESLRAFLDSPEKLERLGAVEGLVTNLSEEARPYFRARLEIETDPEVREAIVAATNSVGGA